MSVQCNSMKERLCVFEVRLMLMVNCSMKFFFKVQNFLWFGFLCVFFLKYMYFYFKR